LIYVPQKINERGNEHCYIYYHFGDKYREFKGIVSPDFINYLCKSKMSNVYFLFDLRWYTRNVLLFYVLIWKLSFNHHLANPFLICRFLSKPSWQLLSMVLNSCCGAIQYTLLGIFSRWKKSTKHEIWTKKKKGNIGKRLLKIINGFPRLWLTLHFQTKK